MSDEIDTTNIFSVGAMGANIIILIPPAGPLSKTEALNLAAYLVAMAEEEDGEFQRVLEAVQGA